MQDLPVFSLLAAVFAAAAFLAYVTTPAIVRLAERLDVVDHPGGRRPHLRPTARLGGLALMGGLLVGAVICASALGATVGLDGLLATLWRDEILAFLFPCALVFLVGLIDDVRGLSPTTRIVVEALAAAFLMQRGYVIDVIANPLGAPIELGLFAFPVTLLWFVGITNAYNLIDGLDGLLGTVASTALLGCAAVAVLADRAASATLAVALAGGIAGFLRWNWHPARIFLGDSGSLLIGFTIAALSLKVARNPFGTLAFHVPLLLCALPIAETTLTLARRYVTGRAYFVGDRSHIHHVLINRGLSVQRAVLALAGISALFSGTAVLSRLWRNDVALGAALITLALAAAGLRWLGYVELRVLWGRFRETLMRPRRAELPHLVALARAGDLIKGATSLPELFERLRAAIKEARLTYVAAEFSAELGQALGQDATHIECHNPLSEQVARRNRPGLWVFSSELPDAALDEHQHAAVCHSMPFDLGDGRTGVLSFHRFIEGYQEAPSTQALLEYLVEPICAALCASLDASAASRAAIGGTTSTGPVRVE